MIILLIVVFMCLSSLNQAPYFVFMSSLINSFFLFSYFLLLSINLLILVFMCLSFLKSNCLSLFLETTHTSVSFGSCVCAHSGSTWARTISARVTFLVWHLRRVPAAVACPVSCGTCGIGMCYEGALFKRCKLSTYSTDVEETA